MAVIKGVAVLGWRYLHYIQTVDMENQCRSTFYQLLPANGKKNICLIILQCLKMHQLFLILTILEQTLVGGIRG